MFGYTADEIIGQPISRLVPPDRPDDVMNILRTIRCGERVEHYETERVRKDGERIWVSLTVSPIKDSNGRVVGASKIARDITERVRAERTRGWLSAIVESSDDAIVSKTLDGIITSWNRGAERIFGYTAAEAVGRPVTMLMPVERQDEEPGILARIRRGDGVEHYETVRRRKDGTLIDVSLTVSPILDSRGAVIGASKIARDVTERKRAEAERERLFLAAERAREAAEAARAEMDDFFDNATIGLHWVRPDGQILRVNRAELDMLGYTRDEYVGHHIAEFYADRDVIDGILSDLLAGHTVRDRRARLRCRDGSIKHALIDSSGLFEDGRFVHTRCFMRDVTARMNAEQQRDELLTRERAARTEAEAANRAKDELLSVVSHELRTPLAAMLGWVGVLKQGRLSPERTARALDIMERSGRIQSELIDDLLDVSRVVSGRLRLDIGSVDLSAIVGAAVEAIRPDARAKKIRIESSRIERVLVAGDAVRLQQVVSNLLGNAVKFTPSGGSVAVSVTRAGDEARVVVRDTGRGIGAEFLPHVFEPFRQGEDVRRRKGGGLGLGLTIAKSLVDQHGGSLTAESDGDDKGATFTVVLPALTASTSDDDALPGEQEATTS